MSARQVAVALYHRDSYSTGRMRQVFGYEAFHWGITVVPEPREGRDCWAFEATDATEINPVTFRMNNPTMSWWLRSQESVNPDLSSKLIGVVVIGSIPGALSFDDMKAVMSEVPLPIKNRHPQQSCVTWVGLAVEALQSRGWVEGFDIGSFKDWALSYADERIKGEASTQPKTVTYLQE